MAMPIHQNNAQASKLYLLWLLLTLSSGSFLGITHPERVDQISLIGIALLVAICLVAIGYFIWQGAAWAKAFFILYTAYSACQTLTHLEPRLTVSASATVLGIGISAILLKDLLTRRRSAAPEAGVAEGLA